MRNLCLIDNKHIYPRFHCNRNGLHLNHYGTNKLLENVLQDLAKLDRQSNMGSMCTLSQRLRHRITQLD